MPYLSHCSEIWGNVNKTNIVVLTKLQKRAIRLINKVGYREPTNKLVIQSNTLVNLQILYI